MTPLSSAILGAIGGLALGLVIGIDSAPDKTPVHPGIYAYGQAALFSPITLQPGTSMAVPAAPATTAAGGGVVITCETVPE